MQQAELKGIAEQVCQIVRSIIRGGGKQHVFRTKEDHSIVTDTDLALNKAITDLLAHISPSVPVISEENNPDPDSFNGHSWILDPLDGTTNFAAGIPHFATSIALVESGKPLAGIVYDPNLDECFAAASGLGAWLNDTRLCLPARPVRRTIAITEQKSMTAPVLKKLADTFPWQAHRNFGSVALGLCWMASGRLHVYLAGRKKIWDYAAGHLILTEAGGRTTTLEGDAFLPYRYQQSICAAVNASLHQEARTLLEDQR